MEDVTGDWSTAKIATALGAFIAGIYMAAKKFTKSQEVIPLDH